MADMKRFSRMRDAANLINSGGSDFDWIDDDVQFSYSSMYSIFSSRFQELLRTYDKVHAYDAGYESFCEQMSGDDAFLTGLIHIAEHGAKEDAGKASYALGERYLKGNGVTQDIEASLYWYGRALTLGNRNAEAEYVKVLTYRQNFVAVKQRISGNKYTGPMKKAIYEVLEHAEQEYTGTNAPVDANGMHVTAAATPLREKLKALNDRIFDTYKISWEKTAKRAEYLNDQLPADISKAPDRLLEYGRNLERKTHSGGWKLYFLLFLLYAAFGLVCGTEEEGILNTIFAVLYYPLAALAYFPVHRQNPLSMIRELMKDSSVIDVETRFNSYIIAIGAAFAIWIVLSVVKASTKGISLSEQYFKQKQKMIGQYNLTGFSQDCGTAAKIIPISLKKLEGHFDRLGISKGTRTAAGIADLYSLSLAYAANSIEELLAMHQKNAGIRGFRPLSWLNASNIDAVTAKVGQSVKFSDQVLFAECVYYRLYWAGALEDDFDRTNIRMIWKKYYDKSNANRTPEEYRRLLGVHAKQLAKYCYESAVKAGDSKAMYEYARAIAGSRECHEWAQKALDAGEPWMCYEIGQYKLMDFAEVKELYGISYNGGLRERCLKIAAEHNILNAKILLNEYREEGEQFRREQIELQRMEQRRQERERREARERKVAAFNSALDDAERDAAFLYTGSFSTGGELLDQGYGDAWDAMKYREKREKLEREYIEELDRQEKRSGDED